MHKIVSYLFFAIIAVLILTHAPGFAGATTAVGGQTTKMTSLLTGATTATSAG